MIEMGITEAVGLWNERLSRGCHYRFSDKCNHGRGHRYCQIHTCPLLISEAKLEMRVIHKFKDIIA